MTENNTVPHDKGLDNTMKLKKEGYRFIPNRMAELNTDIFTTHLMAKKVICITGADAVKLFYDDTKFTRKGAAPNYVKKSLFGQHTVHGLEGEAHKERRSLFLSIFNDEDENRLIKLYNEYLDKSISVWEYHEPIILYNEIKQALLAVVCQWASVPLQEEEKKTRADECMAMVFGFGNDMTVHEEGKAARKVFEKWMEQIIGDIRQGFIEVPEDSPIYKVCNYCESDGTFLDNYMAAVEMINVIRPVVASSIFITFAALALYEFPEYKQRLQNDPTDEYLYKFCEEVRRFYPLTPFLGAVVREDFEWKNCQFKKKELVLLDVYGINHDPKIWANPTSFDPEHFKKIELDSVKLVAQGSGDMKTGHRCPGERLTKKIMMASVKFLAITIGYELVKEQDITYDLREIPTLPKSGILIHNIYRQPQEVKKDFV
ncbi:MAG: cytochrome P450 [bacterium]|nr:cytochrome P450 [bacterium]